MSRGGRGPFGFGLAPLPLVPLLPLDELLVLK
jgi:hypothetical protein